MKYTGNEALIKGVFSPEQAKVVIGTLFRSKIQMHSQTSFSSFVRTGKESTSDNVRKKELVDSLERLLDSIKTISDPELEVKLDCHVKMQFVKRRKERK